MTNDPKQGAGGGSYQGSSGEKEPFIGQGDRPEVRIDPNTPISELRVRDLSDILGTALHKPFHWEKYKLEKPEYKEFKEFKIEKFEKYEKLEWEKLDKAPGWERPPHDFGEFEGPSPDPWRQAVEVISGLRQQVSQLANQVAELQKKVGG
jgi:hypothetical protein